MQWTGLNELREKFLAFFESKEHLRLPSFPLVPDGDKSLLLINSGMAPMKKWFLGTEEPPSHRVCTCQKCIRTPDIESVGITDRHGTYFEMLGNFSFQNYFKEEAILWAWEFFTGEEWLAIPKDLLHISVYEEDDAAYDIWTKEVGVAEDHMVRLGKGDNFWEHGSGPCGPCSEIYFDRGEKYGCGEADCKAGCECDRFIEVWNLVFTEFDSDGAGHYEKLAQPNIDTGMGLERLACVLQDAPNLFEVDTVQKILHHVEKLSGKTYRQDKKTDISIRVVTDHIRSTVFMVGDGILPSNEGRGYVLRRLLRRAARHGRMLGIEGLFLTDVAETVIEQNESAYPELRENASYIKKIIASEEERFSRTIDAGLNRLREMLDSVADGKMGDKARKALEAIRKDAAGFEKTMQGVELPPFVKDRLDHFKRMAENNELPQVTAKNLEELKDALKNSNAPEKALQKLKDLQEDFRSSCMFPVLSGAQAFMLHDTFGFPLDLTREIAAEAGIDVDVDAFAVQLQKQRQTAREDRKNRDIQGWEANLFADAKVDATVFTGYDEMAGDAKVMALSDGEELVEALSTDTGEKEGILVVLDKTPFYAESGGQVADIGHLTGNGARLRVVDVQKAGGDLIVHACVLEKGSIRVGDAFLAELDVQRRRAIMRNHTSAHLLQRALREVLGDHVHQAGSYVDDERMRFDFTHFSAATAEELREVERIVNEKVFEALPVTARTMPISEAKEMGAMALFGEKYGDTVRVIDAGGWSVEFCGGTHVSNTAHLGSFKILSESSVAAGVRRIESTTGYGVLRLLDEKEAMLHGMVTTLKVGNVQELGARVAALVTEQKTLEKELASMKDKAANEQASNLFEAPVDVEGIAVYTALLPNTDAETLRKMCDLIKNNSPAGVGALAGESDGKMMLAVCCGAEAVKRGLAAGALAKQIAAVAGGSGGGKPDMAMAGIKERGKAQDALDAVVEIVRAALEK